MQDLQTTVTDLQFINSFGFFSIQALTPKGRRWLKKNVPSQENGQAYSDDSRMALDIFEGALADGLAADARKAGK